MGKRILAALLTAVFLLSGCSAGRTAGSSDSGTTSAAASGKSDSPDASAVSGKLKIYFFSAGKADAILLYGADFAVLIDTGLKGFGGEIVSYLKEQGIDTLDALILTHFDEDHVGGGFFERFEEGVERPLGKHVDFVDDEHFVFADHRRVLGLFQKVADVIDAGVARRIDFNHVHRVAACDVLAARAFALPAAFLHGGARAAIGTEAVALMPGDQRLCHRNGR